MSKASNTVEIISNAQARRVGGAWIVVDEFSGNNAKRKRQLANALDGLAQQIGADTCELR